LISIEKATKKFENFTALSEISCEIQEAGVFGLVGSNGAGKSTLVRLIAGVYRPDGGTVKLDGEDIYENFAAKSRIAYVSDELYFLPGANLARMSKMYETVRPGFDSDKLLEYAKMLDLSMKNPISQFSKGMKRQAAIILALSCRTDYLFFDETFDGLDPIMRSLVKSLICQDVIEKNTTVIITSHSLRELEDICDQLALLHKGGLVLENDVDNLKTERFKVQIGFAREFDESLFSNIQYTKFKKVGSVASMIIKGDKDETHELLKLLNPVLLDMLPLTLEEVFTYEMEALGYDFSNILKGEE